MAKELVVSSAGHETKVAILEDNQVVEAYFERKREYSLAGSIYKGRVTRVLPGMQSAFVEIGLERDAFLYVSDFFEDVEEYDKIVTSVEEKVIKMEEVRTVGATSPAPPAVPPREASPEPGAVAEAPSHEPAPAPVPAPERSAAPDRDRGPYPSSRRGRHRRSRRRGFPDSKYSRNQDSGPPPRQESSSRQESIPAPVPDSAPIILPGESLAKYRDVQVPSDDRPASGAPAETLGQEEAVQEGRFAEETAQMTAEAQEESKEQETITIPLVSEQSLGVELPIVPPAVWEPPVAEEKSAEAEEEGPDAVVGEPPAVAERGEELDRAVAAPGESDAPAERSEEPEADQTAAFEAKQETPAVWDSEPDNPETLLGESVEESVSAEAEGWDRDRTQDEVAPDAETGPEKGESEPQVQPSVESFQPRQAVVREGGRNPRYQRRSRWGARRPAPTEAETAAPRGGRPRERSAPAPQIADLLKEGQEIIVQIAKEPLGKKGARITSHIALPGRYLVYMPTVNHVGVSHKISSDEERLRLKRIIQEHTRNIPGGFIVRTAGEGQSEEELRADILFLANMWADIRAQAEKAKAPTLLHHDLDLVQRIIRDQLSEDFTAVWVDNEVEYERLVNWVGRFQPSLVGRVKLYTKNVPLFEQMGVQEEIDKALKPKVWLKSGGYIVINQTEALVAIDVNTGKFVGRSSRLEDTIVKTNIDAIQEIVRQIRLRDLGGIIVVDFIDMDERKNRHKVMTALEEALRADRSPSKILAFNEFGLVAITRKRVRQSLERMLGQPCPHCTGSGYVKSAFTVASEIYTEVRKMASELAGRQVTLRVNPEVGKTLKARDNTILSEIEEMLGKPVVIRNDPNLHIENFAFE
jgi:ribonuclease G